MRILSSWRRAAPPVAPAPASFAARYLDHNVPRVAAAGAASVLRVAALNTGASPWPANPPDGHHVGGVAYVDGRIVGGGRFLADTVAPGERATLAVSLTWPAEPGEHRLKIDMLVSDRFFFSAAGTPALELDVTLREAVATPTDALRAAARHDEWFFSPGQGVYRTRDGHPAYPLFGRTARGCTITDVDGREYLDLHMGWGCNLLGYADERVTEALARSLSSGGIASLVHEDEMAVSQALCEWFGLGDAVLFGKNGSDVTTWAVRTARVATGRKTVIYAGYHGWQDWNAAALGFQSTGIPGPSGPAFRFRYADLPALERAAAAHAEDLAAVMIEPAATAHDPQDPDHEGNRAYLAAAEALARRYGALFVLDEIFTGFRFRQRFAQTHFGLRPDLTCLGKALANGYALSALVGRGDVLGRCVGRIFYAPTNKGEAYAFAAARAALAIYRDEDVPAEVWAAGNTLRRGVDTLCAERGLPARLIGAPYRLYMLIEGGLEPRIHARTVLQQELARHGVITHRGYAIVSRAHDGAAIDRCLSAYAAALDAVRAGLQGGALRLLDIPDVQEEGPS